ncbi:hypothetical protein OG218_15160 [Kineococcus sp. NBC_00420]|uniref:hypothetical protein n=1 Tax=unclassified Kineococcus TaxID=2621656 RepID=UPI002E23E42A
MHTAAMVRALQVGSAIALGGGLIFGAMPLPLHNYGCTSAFAGNVNDSADLWPACSQQRADRQNVVLELTVVSLGLAAGAETYLRLTQQEVARRAEETTAPAE